MLLSILRLQFSLASTSLGVLNAAEGMTLHNNTDCTEKIPKREEGNGIETDAALDWSFSDGT